MPISFRVDSPKDAAFRAEFRAWLEKNVPDELRGLVTYPPKEEGLQWQKMLREAGYLAPHWPKKWGGSERSFTQQLIFQEDAIDPPASAADWCQCNSRCSLIQLHCG